MKATATTQVDITMSGEQADLLIEFVLKFARQMTVSQSDQLLGMARELNNVRRLKSPNVINEEFV